MTTSERLSVRTATDAPPTLPIQYVNVRPVNGAIVYTFEGAPIPQETWSMVPVSAGIVNAIKYGDLEEGEPSQPEGQPPAARRSKREQPVGESPVVR
jgi:hypothetical protein